LKINFTGIKINVILNGFRILVGSVIGLFTMPYINKIIGVNGIGKVEYVYSIINYFILFSAIGIPTYGIREVAKVRDNLTLKTKLVIELLLILLTTTIISYIILFGIVLQLENIKKLKSIVLIMSSMIFFTNMGAEWFYQAIEDQLYITIRYVFFSVLAFLLLINLVNNKNDYSYYSLTLAFTSIGSGLFNLFFLIRHLEIRKLQFRHLEVKKHLKPLLTIFLATLSVNIYVQFDNILLGTISGLDSVGYYTVANKLIRFVISLVIIIGIVMLPKLSNLVETNMNEYHHYIKKSFYIMMIASLPMTILIFFLADDIILLMAGESFKRSILTMKILSPMCVIVGIAYFIGFLVLYPQGKERFYTIAVALTSIFSIVSNYFIIPLYNFNGTAIIAILSEILAILIMVYLAKKQIKDTKVLNFNFIKIIISAFIMGILVYPISKIQYPHLIKMISISFLGYCIFLFLLFISKEETLINELSYFKSNKKNIV